MISPEGNIGHVLATSELRQLAASLPSQSYLAALRAALDTVAGQTYEPELKTLLQRASSEHLRKALAISFLARGDVQSAAPETAVSDGWQPYSTALVEVQSEDVELDTIRRQLRALHVHLGPIVDLAAGDESLHKRLVQLNRSVGAAAHELGVDEALPVASSAALFERHSAPPPAVHIAPASTVDPTPPRAAPAPEPKPEPTQQPEPAQQPEPVMPAVPVQAAPAAATTVSVHHRPRRVVIPASDGAAGSGETSHKVRRPVARSLQHPESTTHAGGRSSSLSRILDRKEPEFTTVVGARARR